MTCMHAPLAEHPEALGSCGFLPSLRLGNDGGGGRGNFGVIAG